MLFRSGNVCEADFCIHNAGNIRKVEFSVHNTINLCESDICIHNAGNILSCDQRFIVVFKSVLCPQNADCPHCS